MAVNALWLLSMTWLVSTKVLPMMSQGEPPTYRAILAYRKPEPVGWTIQWTDAGAAADPNFNCASGSWANWNPGFGLQRGVNTVVDTYDNFFVYDWQSATNGIVYDTVPTCLQFMSANPPGSLSGGMISWNVPSPLTQTGGSVSWMANVTCVSTINNTASFDADEFNPYSSNMTTFDVAIPPAPPTPPAAPELPLGPGSPGPPLPPTEP